ncbi:hypothetical protein niasHS_005383 [Heterodera schachtii]|uniref:Protein-serine/threonine kinase n=1 Tax=Heterodera schachtii TaxID=97005 RepID=A0ABD2J9A7_HETSC
MLDLRCFNTRIPDQQISVPLVPLHLYYIVFELLKNSMRATIEHHHRVKGFDADSSDDLAEVRACIVLGTENLSIKISDRGGGVPSAKLANLFHYLYSTAPKPSRDDSNTPFAGYGYGLPISRLYARYFLGDLSLTSMDGYGTDAVISLKAVPSQACELLPVYGASSRRFITMAREAPDYCFQKPTTITAPALDTTTSADISAVPLKAVKPKLVPETTTTKTKSISSSSSSGKAERVAI